MWQSIAMQEALKEQDPISRLIDIFELLHPIPLSDPQHGFVDVPQLIREAHAANVVRIASQEKP
jgi:hypothetical protein